MKIKLVIIAVVFFIFSCKNKNNNTKNATESATETAPAKSSENTEDKINPYDNVDNLNSVNSDSLVANTTKNIAGKYRKKDEKETNCNCSCIELNEEKTTELCLKKDEIYIEAHLEKEQNQYSVYYVSPSVNNKNKKLPWDMFSKTEPIATITPINNGLKLDWLGFKINGKIATDYAIYGKKTLEGNFIKID